MKLYTVSKLKKITNSQKEELSSLIDELREKSIMVNMIIEPRYKKSKSDFYSGIITLRRFSIELEILLDECKKIKGDQK